MGRKKSHKFMFGGSVETALGRIIMRRVICSALYSLNTFE